MAFLVPVFTAIGSAIGGTAAAGAATAGAATAATASTAATALTVGSTLLSAAGALSQARSQRDAAKYNAAIQEQQAKIALNQGAEKATDVARRTQQRTAAARAGYLQGGMELSGSAGDVLSAIETQGALDELTALYDSQVTAQGHYANASLERSSAGSATTAGWFNAGNALLSTRSRYY